MTRGTRVMLTQKFLRDAAKRHASWEKAFPPPAYASYGVGTVLDSEPFSLQGKSHGHNYLVRFEGCPQECWFHPDHLEAVK